MGRWFEKPGAGERAKKRCVLWWGSPRAGRLRALHCNIATLEVGGFRL